MGNPAGERAKKKAKRRKRHEQRIGIGRYAGTEKSEAKSKSKTNSGD